MYGSNAAMQLRDDTIVIDGDSTATSQMRKHVDGQYYGHDTNDEHSALRYVSVIG